MFGEAVDGGRRLIDDTRAKKCFLLNVDFGLGLKFLLLVDQMKNHPIDAQRYNFCVCQKAHNIPPRIILFENDGRACDSQCSRASHSQINEKVQQAFSASWRQPLVLQFRIRGVYRKSTRCCVFRTPFSDLLR